MRKILPLVLIINCITGDVASRNSTTLSLLPEKTTFLHPSHSYVTNLTDKTASTESPMVVEHGESQAHTTWIFVDKPVKSELNDKLVRMANWVAQATAQPNVKGNQRFPVMHPGQQTKRLEQGNGHNQEEEGDSAGTTKAPGCAQYGKYYCSYKEDYPIDVVSQVIKYMKWPLEKLFRDLRTQKFPKIADNADGGLVCDSITRIIRPGWAKNNNGRWVVVINTDTYAQFVTEIICRYDDSYCNFVPPCYQASCQQRYNTQTLLAIDPYNPYKGPFLSKFLFPSCCVCYVPKVKYDKPGNDF